jgi:RHS repeat-associated protein
VGKPSGSRRKKRRDLSDHSDTGTLRGAANRQDGLHRRSFWRQHAIGNRRATMVAGQTQESYTWDNANRLMQITQGSSTVAFQYDDANRRTQLTLPNGIVMTYSGACPEQSRRGSEGGPLRRRNGLNPMQELQNGSASANMLTGLGIDEYFQRSDSAGARDFLTDTLDSTLALADCAGAIRTSYTGACPERSRREPFGKTTATGASSTNPFQFTGGENDGSGLYFNRAGYYSPAMQRFASQDPIGFAGGDANLYAYGSNDPIDLIDPLGLDAYLCDRPIKGFSKEYGPEYHQFICVERPGESYCFGLTTYNGQTDFPGSLFNVPGSLEPDKPNKSCKRQSTKPCVDSCLLGMFEEPAPDYSLLDLPGGMQCHKFATSSIAECEAKCAKSSN